MKFIEKHKFHFEFIFTVNSKQESITADIITTETSFMPDELDFIAAGLGIYNYDDCNYSLIKTFYEYKYESEYNRF